MKYCFLMIIFLQPAFGVFTQAPVNPELKIRHGFHQTRYYLGSRESSFTQVNLHLNQTCPEAGYFWRKGNRESYKTIGLGLVGLGGAAMAVYGKKQSVRGAGLILGGVGLSGSVVFGIRSRYYRDMAGRIYNTKMGY